MKRGQRKRVDEIQTPAPGEKARPPKPGRLPRYDFQLTLEHIARPIGGRAGFIDLARYSKDERIRRLVTIWDSLGAREKRTRSLAELCESVGIEPRDLLAEVVATAWELNVDISKLVVFMNQAQVVAETTKRALEPDGHRERRMFLEASGLLSPAPRQPRTRRIRSGAAGRKKPAERLSPQLPSLEEENMLEAQFPYAWDESGT